MIFLQSFACLQDPHSLRRQTPDLWGFPPVSFASQSSRVSHGYESSAALMMVMFGQTFLRVVRVHLVPEGCWDAFAGCLPIAACANNSYETCRCKIAGATEPEQRKITVIEAVESTSQGNLSNCRAGSQKPATEIANEKSSTLHGIRHLAKCATQAKFFYVTSMISSFIWCVIILSAIFIAKACCYINISSFHC